MTTDYIKYSNDKAYVIKREMSITTFIMKGENHINMEWLKAWRDHLSCDHVLRNETHFMFCKTIQEVEPLPLIKNNQLELELEF
jgi:hypothetical protein